MSSENIVSKKFRILVDKSQHLFDRISFWTRASDVEFNSGKNAQDTLGNIYGISDSLTSTSSNIAASTAAIKAINDKVTNVALGNATQADVLSPKTFSSSAGITKTGTMANLSGAVGYSSVADGTTFARIVLNNTGKITQGTSYVDVPVQTLKDNVSNLGTYQYITSSGTTNLSFTPFVVIAWADGGTNGVPDFEAVSSDGTVPSMVGCYNDISFYSRWINIDTSNKMITISGRLNRAVVFGK